MRVHLQAGVAGFDAAEQIMSNAGACEHTWEQQGEAFVCTK
jgi:hypothetical protein